MGVTAETWGMSRRNRNRSCSSCGGGTTARSIRARQPTANCGTITVVSDEPDPAPDPDPDPSPDPSPDPGDGGQNGGGDLPGGLTREQALALGGAGGLALVYLRSRGN